MIQRHLPALAVALPLAVAALLSAGREWLPRRVLDGIALAVAVAVAAACATLAAHPAAAQAYWFGGWRPGSGPAIGIAFAPDAAGAAFAAFAATLVALAVTFAAFMLEPERGIFHVLVLLFLGGMVGFSLTADLFDLFVFFELMGVSAFALTGWHADEEGPLQGMMTFAVTNTVGALLFLLGTGLLYGRTGALNLASIGRALAGGRADGLVVAAFALLAAGFLVKLAAFPFHFWLPDAHAVAPAPVCALFSGVMVPLGAFGLARVHAAAFHDVLPAGSTAVPLAAIAAATAVVGGAMALVQQHLKRLLAFSTVAHAGTILAGVATANPEGLAAAGLHAFGHGALKLALFMCAGALLDRFGTVDVRRLHGRGREVPELAIVWAFATVGLLDLGPTPTGPAAHLLEAAARAAGVEWVGRALAVGTALTGAALLRAGAQVFLGAGPAAQRDAAQGEQGSEARPEAAERVGRGVAVVVPAVAVAVAYAARFAPGLDAAAASAGAALLRAPQWAAWVLGGSAVPAPLVAVTAVPAAAGAARAIVAVLLALALLGRDRLGALGRRFSEGVHALASPLERLHGGYVGDAVAWIAAGAAVVAAWVALGVHALR